MYELVATISLAWLLVANAAPSCFADDSGAKQKLLRTRVVQTKYGKIQGRVHRLRHPDRHHNVYDTSTRLVF